MPSRRISYVIPSPIHHPPRLILPRLDTLRHGQTGPILIYAHDNVAPSSANLPSFSFRPHPQHRLGVASLALDTSTQLTGRPSPEGILYSGGRDGLVIAWELGITMKKRTTKYGKNNERRSRWEIMTGLGDEADEVEVEAEADEQQDDAIPYESSWETNNDFFQPGKPSQFRQSIQSHTDWVNDILLCNLNQTLVSASSDGTLKAWNPHDPTSALMPTVVGTHSDYVRCLTHSRSQNWVGSGSFDRTVKLWDLQAQKKSPITVFSPPEGYGPKSSVYALATDPAGQIVASGSPERVIRIWDPRSGKRTGKLVGHTDNIRSILISDDARYLLTGSADASIKLWSLATLRCLHTFVHHTESVWSLFSSHPNLEIFYSGDRSGMVCKVDMEGCTDISEGECILLCNDAGGSNSAGSEGINKIVAMDDNLLWTATGSSDMKRWRVPARRVVRAVEPMPMPDLDRDSPASSPVKSPSSPLAGFTYDPMRSPRKRDSFGISRRESFGNLARKESPSRPPKPDSPIPIEFIIPARQTDSPTPSFSWQFMNKTGGGVTIPGRSSASFVSEICPPAAESTLFGIPFQSLVHLTSPDHPYSHGSPFLSKGGGDPDVATLYSAASIMSVHIPLRHVRSTTPKQQPLPPPALQSPIRRSLTSAESSHVSAMLSSSSPTGLSTRFMAMSTGGSDLPTLHPENSASAARAAYEEREVAVDAIPLQSQPDEVIQGSHGLVRSIILNDRIHALTVDTAGEVAVWDIVRGSCLGVFSKEDIAATSAKHGSSAPKETDQSPREALETVRERVEGEAVISAWSTVDTQIGDLTVHMQDPRCFDAEIYADEAWYGEERTFDEEQKLNVGKWVLGNLFANFVAKATLIGGTSKSTGSPTAKSTPSTIRRSPGPTQLTLDVRHPHRSRSTPDISDPYPSRTTPGLSAITPALAPDLPPQSRKTAQAGSKHAMSPPYIHTMGLVDPAPLSPILDSPSAPAHPPINAPTGLLNSPRTRRSNTVDGGRISNQSSPSRDYFSIPKRADTDPSEDATQSAQKPETSIPPTPSTPGGGGGGSGSGSGAGVGFMGRLKMFGKSSKRPVSGESTQTPATTEVTPAVENGQPAPEISQVKSSYLLTKLLAQSLHTPTITDSPPLSLSPHTSILFSEANSDAPSGWRTTYSSSLSSIGDDLQALEVNAPDWLLEYLLAGKAPTIVAAKFSFTVLPWNKGTNIDAFPDIPMSITRLTAMKSLRVRKIIAYIRDKIDAAQEALHSSGGTGTSTPKTTSGSITSLTASPSGLSSPTSSSTKTQEENKSLKPKAEDVYELLCNDTVLPTHMTLIAVKQFVWRQSTELTMYYRKKIA